MSGAATHRLAVIGHELGALQMLTGGVCEHLIRVEAAVKATIRSCSLTASLLRLLLPELR